METTNTNPENQISENQEQEEDDKKDDGFLKKNARDCKKSKTLYG